VQLPTQVRADNSSLQWLPTRECCPGGVGCSEALRALVTLRGTSTGGDAARRALHCTQCMCMLVLINMLGRNSLNAQHAACLQQPETFRLEDGQSLHRVQQFTTAVGCIM
jgi:hypothetical protein